MIKKKLGFIGCGNMGGAMLGGIINANILDNPIYVFEKSLEVIEKLKNDENVVVVEEYKEFMENVDIVILAVKPHIYKIVIEAIKDFTTENHMIVTIAAGQSIKQVEKLFDKEVKVIRTMPNTPALVGQAMSMICHNQLVSQDDLELITEIFNAFGKVELLDEKLIDGFIAVAGSAPAYIFMLIEAMADGAVLEGIPRDKAYNIAAQTVFGSAKMVMDTKQHPGYLKDMVCSPKGTTIEAVAKLEELGFRASIIKAMKSCAKKSRKMSDD